jgi:myo-inositol-1(or 4)-monophosphatase
VINIAKEAARKAGTFVMQHFGKLGKDEIRRKSRNDFISFVDENSERLIVDTIHSVYPEHDILAEEFGEIKQHSAYRWIIDPLDGTTNYISRIPIFAISIALQHNNDLVLAVIYDPVRDELFHAIRNEGAFLNETPIHVSGTTSLSESLIATGFPFKAKYLLKDYLKAFESIFTESIGVRRMGAAAVDMAYVAAGRFEGFWEIGLKPWDMAAGTLIIEEAGGTVTDFWGKGYFLNNAHIIASNGKVHAELADKIQSVFPFYKPLTS